MSYHAVLFDLDGTLLDTLDDIGNAMNRVLAQNGFPAHPIDAYRHFVGDGAHMLILRALPETERDESTVRLCLEGFLEDYAQNWKVMTKPYEGIPEMLEALASSGLKTAILTNKPHTFSEQCVAEFLSCWRFDIVIGQRDNFPRKPDPAGAMEIAGFLDIPAENFLFLGDSAVDMQTAVAASMFPVGALWGFRSADELKQNGAKALIDHPLKLLNLLDNTTQNQK
jgi:phosphoglycolate phosphatase